jgi:hypothetical protein
MAVPQSLAYRALDRHVIHGQADEIAFAGHGRPMTYAQLLHDSACIAGAMREIGVAEGTTVRLDISARREHVIALMACVRLAAELDEGADFVLSGEPVILRTPVTEVPWDVLVRAGRIDPAPAPETDPEGYEQRLATAHGDILIALIAGDTLT